MSWGAFLLILLSAFTHVTWNTIAKKSHFSLAFYCPLELTAFLLWGHAIIWVPISFASLPAVYYGYIIVTILFDLLYGFGLRYAYGHLEMSTAYPMMRSIPLILSAILTSIFHLGTPLRLPTIGAILIVFCGCLLTPLQSLKDFRLKTYINKNFLAVFLVACGTTGYTIFDKETLDILTQQFPHIPVISRSLFYYGMRSLFLVIGLIISVLCSAPERQNSRELMQTGRWKFGVLAGLFASTTYATVLTAMNMVTNVSYVQAFRQIGLIFGLLVGVFFLHEKCSWAKVSGVFLIVLGLILSVLI